MLGEKVMDIQGKVSGQRAVQGAAHGEVKIEVSFQGMGHVLGMEGMDMGTYVARVRQPGVLYGSGHGITMMKDGESITWHGEGLGHVTGKGMEAKWRGCLFMQTQSQKLARLNAMPVIFEWDVDEQGNAKGVGWEWK
jgi:hypothetical protein